MKEQEKSKKKDTNYTGRQRAMAFSKIEELIDICRRGGVSKIEIPDTIKLELFPFSYKPEGMSMNFMENKADQSDNMTEEDILLMSANT